ncbi:hypothetical protein BDP27DRAFT_1365200 [Rhodocollybia butyracea]|uniref:F-box domain-containing protein n=1 Tax=Rhodocollybia butyracea TaxID=206335 RepID=A0A9P5PPY8_9AGAR|nr:hypothetical protein BDP27DRAFT_1365200 [Rhodocollybia butyracea]
MPSLLVELPNDVLFNVIEFLPVPEIFAIRVTCKRFQTLTKHRHVWTAVFRRSDHDSFLPVVDLASQTAGDLERILLRACQLDTLWLNPPPDKLSFQRRWSLDSATLGIDISADIHPIEIYLSRYLILLHKRAILVYDILTKHEAFRQNAPDDQEFCCLYDSPKLTRMVMVSETDYFLPFALSNTNTVSMCRITPLGIVTVTDCPEFHFGFEDDVWRSIGHDLAIVNPRDLGQMVQAAHLPSRKVYPISARFMDEPSITFCHALFLPGGHVLLNFIASNPTTGHYFALYHPSDHTLLSTGTLHPSHQGHLAIELTRYDLLSSKISVSDRSTTGLIWLLVNLRRNGNVEACPLCITLQADGHLSFDLAAPSSHRIIWSLNMNMNLTVNLGGRARGIAYYRKKDQGRWHFVLCDVGMDCIGEPLIRTAKIDISEDPHTGVMVALDVCQGRGVSLDHTSGVHILDLVL